MIFSARLAVSASLVAITSMFAATTHADELTVYVYPAPITIDWRTPKGLALSTILNNFEDDDELTSLHTIGHMNFDLNCRASETLPEPVRIFTGQTNSDDEEMNDELLDKGYGFGVMLADHRGLWENQKDIEHDLPIRYKRGTVEYMHIQIAPATCARVARYLRQYQALGLDQIYGGLESRPRLQQGGGCAAFAESVLEIAGLMAPEWQSYWSHSVNVPRGLIGGPITGNDVGVLELIFGFDAFNWAKPGSANAYPLTFWDPNLAWWWIKYANQQPVALSGMTYKSSHRSNAKGIEIDATAVPTPEAPFFLSAE